MRNGHFGRHKREKVKNVILINRWNLSKSINLSVIAFHRGIKKGRKFWEEKVERGLKAVFI